MNCAKQSAKIRYAESLSEIYQHIRSIETEIEQSDGDKNPIMWFRGNARSFYNLEPSIFRGTDYLYNKQETYSNNHLREDYRFQSFMSRNYDNVDYRMPQTVIEWQEVMQHFFTKTRLMDWSESLTVALEFALESFITPVKDLEIKEKCRVADPVIWILQPVKLNKAVYDSFVEQDEQVDGLIRKALAADGAEDLAKNVWDELVKEKDSGIYYNMGNDQDKNMNTMIGLSALEIVRNAYKGCVREVLTSYEMNPFFYLLLRYYADGVPVLPPLAIIHPYHSQRIKIQKGVFTVFPYYIPDDQMEKIKQVKGFYPPVGMEYMPKCSPCLHRIRIVNPQKVARELMQTGARRGNLYPDMQIVSQDMENAIM